MASFAQAVNWMLEGKSVRRKDYKNWHPYITDISSRLFIKNNRIHYNDNSMKMECHADSTIKQDSINALDWEIYDEKTIEKFIEIEKMRREIDKAESSLVEMRKQLSNIENK